MKKAIKVIITLAIIILLMVLYNKITLKSRFVCEEDVITEGGDAFNYTRKYTAFFEPTTSFKLYINNGNRYMYLETFVYDDDIPYLPIKFISTNEQYNLYNIPTFCDFFTINKEDNSYVRVSDKVNVFIDDTVKGDEYINSVIPMITEYIESKEEKNRNILEKDYLELQIENN